MTAPFPKTRKLTARSILIFGLLLLSTTLITGCNAISGGDVCCGICASGTNPRAASDVEWGPLNPARGDQSPQAGDLWGDRTGGGATGFLVKFRDGFSSPPHIHNVTYRGIVIHGSIHNDHPDADESWVPAASFWVQPAGGVHITAAQGKSNVAYIEIAEGPYLVHPPAQAFASQDQPRNIKAQDMPWADTGHGVQTAHLWGDPDHDRPSGTLVKFPAGFRGEIQSRGGTLHAVVIVGGSVLHPEDQAETTKLEPGNYFGSTEKAAHRLTTQSTEHCIVYLRTDNAFDIVSNPSQD